MTQYARTRFRGVAGRRRAGARRRNLAFWAILLVMTGGCTSPQAEHPEDVRQLVIETPAGPLDQLRELPTVDVASLQGPAQAYRIGIEDVLSIRGDTEHLTSLSGAPGISVQSAKVKPDGKVYLPVLGGIDTAGKTVVELQKAIQDEIVKRRLKDDPFVTVDVTSFASQRFYVVGEVGRPGAFEVDGQTKLLDALLKAGGVSPKGDLERSYIVRGGALVPVSLAAVVRRADMSQNITLRHEDVIFIPSAENRHIYIFGEVPKQGVQDMGRKSMSLIEALALAGGLTPNTANQSDITIFRGSLTNPRCFRISECEIMALGPHIGLHPNDRILVGPSNWATAKKALDLVQPFLDATLNAILIPFTVESVIDNN